MKKKTQVENVLEYLQEHGSITYLEAFHLFGVANLGSVINKVRGLGYDIQTVMEQKPNRSKAQARYYLEKTEQERPEPKRQPQIVLEYLQEHGSVTSQYMRDHMHIKKPTSVIDKLRNGHGCQIETNMMQDITGRWVAEWILKDNTLPKKSKKRKKPTRKDRTPKALSITCKTGGWWKRR